MVQLTDLLLTTDLPDTVALAGREVGIHTGYRRGVKALQAFESGNADAATYAITYFFDVGLLESLTGAQMKAVPGAIERWLRCGQRKRRGSSKAVVWSWRQDTDAVLADFQRYYRIDLVANRDMHWWQFRALFDCLPPKSESAQRMHWRGPCPKGASKDEQAHHNEMRRNYPLKEM